MFTELIIIVIAIVMDDRTYRALDFLNHQSSCAVGVYDGLTYTLQTMYVLLTDYVSFVYFLLNATALLYWLCLSIL